MSMPTSGSSCLSATMHQSFNITSDTHLMTQLSCILSAVARVWLFLTSTLEMSVPYDCRGKLNAQEMDRGEVQSLQLVGVHISLLADAIATLCRGAWRSAKRPAG